MDDSEQLLLRLLTLYDWLLGLIIVALSTAATVGLYRGRDPEVIHACTHAERHMVGICMPMCSCIHNEKQCTLVVPNTEHTYTHIFFLLYTTWETTTTWTSTL